MNRIDINKQLKAYQMIFTIENKLRVSMHNIMVKKEGSDYFTNQVFPEFKYGSLSNKEKTNVVMSAKQRRGRNVNRKMTLCDNPILTPL